MDHTISIHNDGELAGNQEPEFSVESPDIDVPPTLRQGSFSTIRPMNRIRPKTATSNHPRRQNSPANTASTLAPRSRTNPVKSHTHMQQVAAGQLVNREGDGMGLDRGELAGIDRRVFAELDHYRGTQTVKVPVSDAVWSTWRRYCEAIGLTMGEGIAGMIDHELKSVINDGPVADGDTVFAGRAEERIAAREERTSARELAIESVEQRLRGWERRLGAREMELHNQEQRARTLSSSSSSSSPTPTPTPEAVGHKVGRNERCPCGSGLKYKYCHGLSGRGA